MSLFLKGDVPELKQLTPFQVLGVTAYWRGVNMIADRMVELPLSVVLDGETAEGNDVQVLLENGMAEWNDSTDFVRTIVVHLLTHGNFLAMQETGATGQLERLVVLDPSKVTKVEVVENELVYHYAPGTETKRLKYSETFHVKGLSGDGVWGLSPVTACHTTLQLALQATQFGSDFFKNSAMPSVVLTSEKALNEAQEKALASTWSRQYGPDGERHGVAMLGGITGVHTLTMPPENAQYLETRQEAVRDVGRVLGIPSQLLGDTASSTYNNVQAMHRALVSDALTPLATRIVSAIDKQLLQKPYTARFDFEGAVAESFMDQIRAYSLAVGGEPLMSVSEAREKLGLDPDMDMEFDFPRLEEEENEQTE